MAGLVLERVGPVMMLRLLHERGAGDVLGGTLLLGGGACEGDGFGLGGRLLVVPALLAACKGEVGHADDDEGAEDDGDDDAARVEGVDGLHADVYVVAVDGADVAAETVACCEGDGVAVPGLDLAVDRLADAGCRGSCSGLEAILARLVLVGVDGRGGGGGGRGRVFSGHHDLGGGGGVVVVGRRRLCSSRERRSASSPQLVDLVAESVDGVLGVLGGVSRGAFLAGTGRGDDAGEEEHAQVVVESHVASSANNKDQGVRIVVVWCCLVGGFGFKKKKTKKS